MTPHIANKYDWEYLTQATLNDIEQCDQHLRNANERAADEQIEARRRLVMRFLPFIWLEDQNLDTAALMKRVAVRLWVAARAERERRATLQSEMVAAE
jgi:hypothetical protein